MRAIVDIIGDVVNTMRPYGDVYSHQLGVGNVGDLYGYNPGMGTIAPLDLSGFDIDELSVSNPPGGNNDCKLSLEGDQLPGIDIVYINFEGFSHNPVTLTWSIDGYKLNDEDVTAFIASKNGTTIGADIYTLNPSPPIPIATDPPYYLHGHPRDIINILSLKATKQAMKYTRFPLIALFQDFKETGEPGYASTADLHLVICTLTRPEYTAAERYDNTFDAILYPLYDEFIAALEKSTELVFDRHTVEREDRLYWGREGLYENTGNIFNDFIDAIEIINLNVKILNQLNTC